MSRARNLPAVAVTGVTPTAVSDQANSSTGYFDLPAGTDAQRPASPTAGALRWNTTSSVVEQYNGTAWSALGGGGGGGGGSPAGSNKYVQFNNSGAFGADEWFQWDSTAKLMLLGKQYQSAGANVGFYIGDSGSKIGEYSEFTSWTTPFGAGSGAILRHGLQLHPYYVSLSSKDNLWFGAGGGSPKMRMNGDGIWMGAGVLESFTYDFPVGIGSATIVGSTKTGDHYLYKISGTYDNNTNLVVVKEGGPGGIDVVGMTNNTVATDAPALNLGRSRGLNMPLDSSSQRVQNGDTLGYLRGIGDAGYDWRKAVEIEFYAEAASVSDVDGALRIATWTGNSRTERIRMNNAGYWMIGYTSSNGAYRLQVNSQIFATSATVATSDGRYKQNVMPIENALELVKRLNPVAFDWKKHAVHDFDLQTRQVGFIAQQVQDVMEGHDFVDAIVKKNSTEIAPGEVEEFLGLSESGLIPILTKALQEATARIEALERRLGT